MNYSTLLGSNYKMAYGGIVVKQNLLLLREPANHYDDYVWTFPKGRNNAGETPEETAIREVLEETGVIARIVSSIPGDFIGGTTINRYFLMEPIEETGKFDWETITICWATIEEAFQLINKTRNEVGLKRDLALLNAITQIFSSDNKRFKS
jgi:8-oxo-dGTP pyrophosphatase MutT (NUDIX family)